MEEIMFMIFKSTKTLKFFWSLYLINTFRKAFEYYTQADSGFPKRWVVDIKKNYRYEK